MKDRKGPALIAAMRDIIRPYKTAGFVIQTALMDGEFQHICGELAEAGVTLKEMGRDEHVGMWSDTSEQSKRECGATTACYHLTGSQVSW